MKEDGIPVSRNTVRDLSLRGVETPQFEYLSPLYRPPSRFFAVDGRITNGIAVSRDLLRARAGSISSQAHDAVVG